MKNVTHKYLILLFTVTLALFFLPLASYSQEYKDKPYHNIEEMEDQNQGLYDQIYDIVKLYPDFSYKYDYKDGKLAEVSVEGVPREVDRKRLELLIYNWKKNSDKIKNEPNRTGVYYSVEEDAEPVMGYVDFHKKLIQNIDYPHDAKTAGVGGIVYLKFIVDEDGDVHYLTASEDIDSPYPNLVKKLKKQAIQAFKDTDADWRPATVDGVPVASYVVEPVYFDFEKNPMIPGLIR